MKVDFKRARKARVLNPILNRVLEALDFYPEDYGAWLAISIKHATYLSIGLNYAAPSPAMVSRNLRSDRITLL